MNRRARATRSTVVEGDNEMSNRGRLLLSRRQLLKYGGLTAAAAAAAGLGPRLVGTILQPGRALAVDRPPDLKLVGTDGWISLPRDPVDLLLARSGVTDPPGHATRRTAAYDLHLRLRERERPGRRRPVQPEEQGPALGARCSGPRGGRGLPGPADQRRPGPAARPVRRAHRSTGTASRTSSRSSTASRRGRSRSRRARRSPTSTSRTTRAPTCSTATWRTRSTCRWG